MILHFTFESCLKSRCCCSVAQSCPTLCDPTDCSTPSPTPGVYSNSRPLSRWCHPTLWSCVAPFSSCLQSFPASGSFPMSWLFASGGQSIRASASASVLPMNIQGWFLLGLTGCPRVKSLLQHHNSFLRCSAFFVVQLSHPYMTTGKNTALTRHTFVGKVMSLLLNMLSRLDSVLKSREITLQTKVCLVKAMVFPVVMYRYRIGP